MSVNIGPERVPLSNVLEFRLSEEALADKAMEIAMWLDYSEYEAAGIPVLDYMRAGGCNETQARLLRTMTVYECEERRHSFHVPAWLTLLSLGLLVYAALYFRGCA